MRNKHLFGMALAAVMTAACSFVDEPVDAPRSGGLSATVEGSRSSTRAGFDKDGAFYWSNEDYLGVTTDQGMTSFTQLKLTSGGGTAKAGFEGDVFGEIKGYAVYPVSDDHQLNGNTLTYHLPEAYTYTKVDADYFTTTQGDGNSFNPPMWGSIINNGSNKTVTLQHLGGVFCVKIPKMPVEAGTFILSADEQITGNFTADLSVSEPVIATPTEEGAAATATSAVSGNNKVTITFSGATANSPGVFYVPVPTGTYSNVRVKVTDGTTAKVNAVAGVYTVNRKDLKKIEPTSGSVEATVATESGSLSDAATALASNDAVAVTSEITSSQSITIPSVSSSTGETSKSLSLEKVATGASLAVTDGNTTGNEANSVDNFTLSIPNNETPEFNALDVTINMPNTTVTLAGNGGVATYGEVTASTADNTLVLSSGVKVNKVIVKKGNIRVNKGAELVAIEKDNENTAEIVTVYVEEGAKIPTLPDGFKVASDDELVTLKMTAAKGGSYTMTGDLTLDEPLVVETGVTFTLDLNGHALKANPAGLTKVLNTSDAVVLVRRGATLTINDSSKGQGSIDANNVSTVYGAVKLTDKEDGATGDIAKLIVNDGQLKGYYYGIAGNGTRHDTKVVVNGGKIINTFEEGSAIYHPQAGTLIVTGGEIVGANTGIELRSGTLSISGGTISCTRTDNVIEPNGSGTTVSGAALAISQHTTNKAISVTISGGTFTGPYALYEEDLQDDKVSDIKITGVSGGTFNGKIYSENCTEFISGGTFSDPSALAYLTEKADVNVKFTDDTELAQTIIVPKGNVIIDLGDHTLTTAATATEYNGKVTAIAVKDGATATVKNGYIGDASASMLYGVYADGKANVMLKNVHFSDRVTYAYNGEGKLDATSCTFRGWLSAWHHGGRFDGCTFTIGKKWYPAAICYGSTTFTNCKFFKNGTDADTYGDSRKPDSDGYYRCNYVVAGCNPATTIDFTNCKFINEDGKEVGDITIDNHPYHACGWGDGSVANAQITVGGVEITSQCTDASQPQE